MLRRTPVLILIVALALCASAYVEASWDRTGHDWNSWKPALRHAYLMGVLDTWVNVNAVIKGTEEISGVDNYLKVGEVVKDQYGKLVECQKGKLLTYDKVYKLVQAEMVLHPDEIDGAMASKIWTAVYNACQELRQEREGNEAASEGNPARRP